MTQGPVFLIGGGWTPAAFPAIFGRFAAAVRARAGDGPQRIACVLLQTEDREAYFAGSAGALASVGAGEAYPVFVSPEQPLQGSHLEGAAGVLVGGGLTPAYHDAIVPTASAWLPHLLADGIPYAGFSAGAMIAPRHGIIGGWKLRRTPSDLAICSEDVSEDEEYLDVRPGLGLVPFAVDVHASQYGTPTRLLHAVRAGLVPHGWAVDEDTVLEVSDGSVAVHGLGCAYRARRTGPSFTVDILEDGDRQDIT